MATKHVYVASDINRKRHRRTQNEMLMLKVGLREILQDDHPQTVRGVFTKPLFEV